MEWKNVNDKSREKLHLISFAVHSLNANLVTTSELRLAITKTSVQRFMRKVELFINTV